MVRSTILGCFVMVALASSAFAGDLLICGDVKAPDGTQIGFSVPVQVVEALKTSGLSAMMQDKDQFNVLVDGLMGDLSSMCGKNLLEISCDKVRVKVGVAEVGDDNPEEANFVKLDVKPAGENQPDFHFRIPKGLFFLGAFIGNQFMETHGKEILGVIEQQIKMNCMQGMQHVGACNAPCCAQKAECEKAESCEKMKKEGDEKSEKEIQKEIEKKVKDVDPEAIKKLILENILKNLQ